MRLLQFRTDVVGRAEFFHGAIDRFVLRHSGGFMPGDGVRPGPGRIALDGIAEVAMTRKPAPGRPVPSRGEKGMIRRSHPDQLTGATRSAARHRVDGMPRATCPQCGKSKTTDFPVGTLLRCPRCRTEFRIQDDTTHHGPRLQDLPGEETSSRGGSGGKLSKTAGGSPIPDNAPMIGAYKLVAELGTGGMGRVYKAIHAVLKKKVAVKVLSRRQAKDADVVARFRREARAAAELDHPNIVKVFEVGMDSGRHYFVMEYVAGGTVAELIRRNGKLPWRQAAEIALSVAQALDVMHEKSLVHRDIKPSNILITRDGAVKLSDLGLVRNITDEDSERLTAPGQILGTMDYLSPEQVAGSHEVDIRSDIYSLGCTLYHMLAGEAPYIDRSVYDKLTAHLHEPLPSVTTRAPDVPEMLAHVLKRMTAKDPDKRHQKPSVLIVDLEGLLSMGDSVELFAQLAKMADELERKKTERAVQGNAVPVTTPSSTVTQKEGSLSHWLIVAGAIGAILVLALLLILLLNRPPRSRGADSKPSSARESLRGRHVLSASDRPLVL
jgi:serine/threonine protein kinase